MAKRAGLMCQCGGTFAPAEIEREGVRTKALVCSGCKRVTFTEAQASRYVRMRLMKVRFGRVRKVVRIGNSLGVTLPEGFAKPGQKVHFIPKDENRLELLLR